VLLRKTTRPPTVKWQEKTQPAKPREPKKKSKKVRRRGNTQFPTHNHIAAERGGAPKRRSPCSRKEKESTIQAPFLQKKDRPFTSGEWRAWDANISPGTTGYCDVVSRRGSKNGAGTYPQKKFTTWIKEEQSVSRGAREGREGNRKLTLCVVLWEECGL